MKNDEAFGEVATIGDIVILIKNVEPNPKINLEVYPH